MKTRMTGVALAALMWSSAAQAADVASTRIATPDSVPAAAVFLNARDMPLPRPGGAAISLDKLKQKLGTAQVAAPRQMRTPRQMPGNSGGKVLSPIQIVPDTAAATTPPSVKPMAVGQSGFPFSTARVDLAKGETSAQYPYRAAGRLGFRYRNQNASCSASLIGPGLLLTAAHCVAEYGSGRFLPDARWAFVPGYYKGKGAYGTYQAQAAFAPKSYIDGTAACSNGVVCPNDVALIVLKPGPRKRLPGNLTGWLGVDLDGAGFTEFLLAPSAQIGQLGYPGGLDRGSQMMRNDALGLLIDWSDPDAGEPPNMNITMGSAMDGGSSGGPWITNLGIAPDYGSLTVPMNAIPNTIIGVTSWGTDDNGEQATLGASYLTSENLGSLLTEACSQYPAACAK